VKANTRRENRLAFDFVARVYDAARPAFPQEFVARACGVANLHANDQVLEIGAGTGQLTLPLRSMGLRILALEPGDELRAILRQNASGDRRVEIRSDFFESYDPGDTSFAAVAAANAFHWVDPAVSYSKAASILEKGGHLLLFWNFPILAPELQRVLNTEVFAGRYPDFVRDPENFKSSIERGAAEGRAELANSRMFNLPWFEFTVDTFSLDVTGYVSLLTSYANAAVLTDRDRGDLELNVRETLDSVGAERLEVLNYLYTCVAEKAL
jgi:SAM-dependent methyltransferase